MLRILTFLFSALGALTFGSRSLRQSFVAGGKKFRVIPITLDNSYPTGGYAITRAQLGLAGADNPDAVIPIGPASTGHWALWDATNNKLKFFSAAGTELAGASAALNAATISLLVIGN